MSSHRAASHPVSTTPFSVVVEPATSPPDATLVRVCGSCTMVDSQRLADELIKAASKSPRPLIFLDLAGLDFITSNGLGSIVAGYLRCRLQQGELRLVSPRPAILDLLNLTRLTALFKVYDSIEAARAVCLDRP